ncbi:hypothetical protein CMI37_32800 [Candidatus Pacearchaeota archaeon]|nr:hypothetical protein [Candidatus Pacearchaeota archaeon]|tara:strand:+ start:16118 stop:16558 length:441 start_codon:yes stop_codon:yes gene_type:complete
MATLDYLAIENAIKDLLDADGDTSAYTIEVEPSEPVRTDACPYVAIWLNSWDSPADDELIGGANPIRTFLIIEIWCYAFSLENLDGATLRDTMLSNVKDVLKANRTLSDKVVVTRFDGGDFQNQKNTGGLGFFKGVSIRINCEVRE